METIKNAVLLYKVIWKNRKVNSHKDFSNFKKSDNKMVVVTDKSKTRRVLTGIFTVISALFFIAYMCLYAVMMTRTFLAAGIFEELLYTFMLLAQLMILFLGSMVVITNLYYSTDNMLLATLPISTRSVFLAKFALSYTSQLIFSAGLYMPMFLASGIYANITGYPLGAEYYIMGLLNVLFLPIIPLLLISLLSFPIMYIITKFKHRSAMNIIGTLLIVLVFVVIYLLFFISMNKFMATADESGNFVLPPEMYDAFQKIKNAGIYNFLIVNAMLGIHPAGYFFADIAKNLVLLVITLAVSSLFYKKGMLLIFEKPQNESKKQKNNFEKTYKTGRLLGTFIKKELRTLVSIPSILISTVMPIVMIPVIGFIFTSAEDMGAMGVGMILYVSFLMIVSANVYGMIAFSLEGKNFYLLKTLPIGIKEIIIPKLVVSNILNGLVALSSAITIGFVAEQYNIIVAIAIFVILIIGGAGGSCYGLYNDIKNPNFEFKNINELTKNNKRTYKTILAGMPFGFLFIIISIVASVLEWSIWLSYLVILGTALLCSIAFAAFGYYKLFKKTNDIYKDLEV